MKTTNTAYQLSFSRLAILVIAPPDGIAPYRSMRPLVRTDKTSHLPRCLWQLNHISTFLQELIRIEIHNSSIGSEGHFSKVDLTI